MGEEQMRALPVNVARTKRHDGETKRTHFDDADRAEGDSHVEP